MTRLFLAAAAALLTAGCGPAPSEPRVEVEEAWVRLPAAPGRPGALYFTLAADHDSTRLTGIAMPAAERMELHGTRMEGGMTHMGPLAADDSRFEGGRLVFAPGGRHAMIYGLPETLRPGERVAVTFTFDPAPPVTVEAEVRGPGDSAPARRR